MTNTELAVDLIQKHFKDELQTFFTSEEWDAIASGMGDYSDYGDKEADIADSIQSKIYQLFAS